MAEAERTIPGDRDRTGTRDAGPAGLLRRSRGQAPLPPGSLAIDGLPVERRLGALGLLHEGLWEYDVASGAVFLSASARRILGIPAKADVGHGSDWLERIHPDDVDEVREAVAPALVGEQERFMFQMRLRHQDGTYRWLRGRGMLDVDPGGSGRRLVGVVDDVSETKRQQAALDQLFRHHASILDAAGDGIICFDADALVTYANPAAAAGLGLDPVAMLGLPHERWLHLDGVCGPRQDSSAACPLHDALRRGRLTRVLDGELLGPDGNVVPYTGTFAPLEEGGTITGAVFTFADATESREARQLAEEGSRQLRHAQQFTRFGSWRWDVRTDHVTWSDELYQIYGVRPEAFAGDSAAYLAFVHPEDRDAVIDALTAAVEAGESFSFGQRIVRPDGSTGWVVTQGDVIRDVGGNALALQGTSQDISDWMRMYDELSKSKTRLDEAQRVAHVGSWEWDIINDDIFWSDELYRLYGVEPGDLTPRFDRFLDLVHPEDRGAVERIVKRAMADAEPFEMYHRLVRPGGEVRWLHGRGTVETDKHGTPVRMMGTAFDITELRRAQEERDRAGARLGQREKLAALGTLVAGVAHELRTPMTYVVNNLHLIRARITADRQSMDSEGTMSPDVLSELDHRTREALSGMTRIDGLLRDIKALYAPVEAPMAECDLGQLVAAAVDLFKGAYKGPVRVRTDIEPDVVARADAGQIQQIVINLLNNGADAMPGGGTLDVVLRTDAEGSLLLIEDEGPGIDAEQAEDIFEPFVTSKKRGTGLGLFLVKTFVEAHEGTIEVCGRPNGGSCFMIRLPACADGAAAPESYP